MSNETSQIIKKSGSLFFFKIVSLFVSIIINAILTRILNPNMYGIFTYFYNYIFFVGIISTLGLDQGLVAFIPILKNKKDQNNLITLVFITVLLISIFFSVLIFLYANYFATLLDRASFGYVIRMMCPLIVLLSLLNLSIGYYKAFSDNKSLIISNNIIFPFSKMLLLLFLFFVQVTNNLYSIVVVNYISLTLVLLYVFSHLIKKITIKIAVKERKYFSDTMIFSLPLLFSGIMGIFLTKIDIMMLGYMISDEVVAIYNVSVLIGTMGNFVLVSVNNMYGSSISRLYNERNMKALSESYKKLTQVVYALNLFIFLIIFMFSEEILGIFGDVYRNYSNVLVVTSLRPFLSCIVGSVGLINIMTGKPIYNLYVQIISIFVNCILNYIFIPDYGPLGASIASVFAVIICNTLAFIFMFKRLRIHPFSFNYLKCLIFVVPFLIISIVNEYITNTNEYLLFFFEAILLFVFCFCIYYMFILNHNEKNKIKDLFVRSNSFL